MGTIQSVKEAMGFEPGHLRIDACSHCQHAVSIYEGVPPRDTVWLKCMEGGFRTTPLSVCDRHITKKGASHGL